MREESDRGDPQGRRVAKRRAGLLSGAGNVARSLLVILERADFDTALCAELLKQLGREEAKQLQISYGRVEPRRRFKRASPQPILQNRPINLIFPDECGISNPEPLPPPRVFALGAVAMDAAAADEYRLRADALKRKFLDAPILLSTNPTLGIVEAPFISTATLTANRLLTMRLIPWWKILNLPPLEQESGRRLLSGSLPQPG